MAGGGGGPSPPSHAPPPAPTSGGEFLLQLLHKSPQTQTPSAATATTTAAAPPNPPPPSLPVDPSQQLDPAVAAVGPTIPFPPYPAQGHDLRGPWLNTFNPPYHPSFLPPGLPQNPWSVAGFSPPAMNGLDFHHSTHMRGAHPFYSDELQRLGLLSNTGVSGNPGYPPQQQNQPKKNMLMFGTLACEVQDHKVLSNGAPSDRHSKGAERENDKGQARFQKGHEVVVGSGSSNSSEIHSNFSWNSQLEHRFNFHGPRQGNYSVHEEGRGRVGRDRQQHSGFQRSVVPEQRRAPPGFAQKPIAKGQWGSVSGRQDLERNVGREETSRRELRHQAVRYVDEGEKIGRQGPEHGENCSDVSSGSRLIRQLDHPGPPTGSNLHSASASDIEESLASAHGEVVEWVTTRVPREETRNRDGSSASGRQSSREKDDLGEELIGSLMLRDGLRQRNDVKKLEKSRDKESTLDIMRGQRVLNPRMRNFKRQVACRYDIERLNAPLLEIYESLIPAEEEKKKQKQLLALLEKLVNKEWPKARLYIYGSCANSFGFSNSDIDVCLVIEDTEVSKSEILLKLADILQSDNLQDVQALTRARVPIVKLMDPVTGISGDICINNILAVVNTKLLRDYAQIDPRLRQLAFIVKHWAKSRRVNETYQGTLSSYAYVLMCIHFLQQRKPAILPSLQGMETTYAVTIDDVECAYFDQVENLCEFGSQNKESIAQLVWAFFDYWAYRHDYANAVISVRTGSIISKRAKDWTRRIGNDRHLICIEDPFEISHDLGRVVDKYTIKVLREEFERAANIMQHDPDPCVTLFEPYVRS